MGGSGVEVKRSYICSTAGLGCRGFLRSLQVNNDFGEARMGDTQERTARPSLRQ